MPGTLFVQNMDTTNRGRFSMIEGASQPSINTQRVSQHHSITASTQDTRSTTRSPFRTRYAYTADNTQECRSIRNQEGKRQTTTASRKSSTSPNHTLLTRSSLLRVLRSALLFGHLRLRPLLSVPAWSRRVATRSAFPLFASGAIAAP